jgi:hypothetical protein
MKLRTAALSALMLAGTMLGAAPAPAQQTPAGPDAPIEHADYANPTYWLCKPGRQDACTIPQDSAVVAADGSVKVETFKADPNAPIDCFYIYPTVSNDNFSSSDLIANAEEINVVKSQFARFGAACRTYAPMYRQTTLVQLRAGLSNGAVTPPPQRGAKGQGNADVDDAWDYYMKNDNKGRGVIIIGHSQGASQVTRLIKAKIEGQPVQKQLIAAYIVGAGLTVAKGKDTGGTFTSIPVCKSAGQTGCVISYGSFRDTVPAPATGMAVGASTVNATADGACANPASLGGGKGEAKSYWAVEAPLNSSLKKPERWSATQPLYQPFASTPGLITTECVVKDNKSFLQVHVNADPKDKRADDIYGDVLSADGKVNTAWGLHNVDMNLMMGNFIDIAKAQAKAYMAKNK